MRTVFFILVADKLKQFSIGQQMRAFCSRWALIARGTESLTDTYRLLDTTPLWAATGV